MLKCRIQTKHTTKQTDGNCRCEDCDFKCEKTTELQKHLAKTHNVVFRLERIIFENIND